MKNLSTPVSPRLKLSSQRGGGTQSAAPAATIPRRDNSGPTPTSYAQRRLWFLDQLEPSSALYNMAYNLRLVGPLDVESLRLAFEVLAQRHEALRTTFETRDGEPLQHVNAPGVWSLPVVDLSGLPVAEREAEFRRVARAEARLPFDLGRGPLFRTTLVKLAAAEHVLLGTMHHIIGDGWSMRLLLSEIATQYEAHREGRSASLPVLPLQYGDFAVWQRQRLSERLLEKQLAYWEKVLADVPPVLELPADRRRPTTPTYRGDEVEFVIPAALGAELKALAAHEGATFFMALLAAFQAFLGRWSGKQQVVIGTPIAGRDRRELEGLIGLFLNTLVLVADLRDDPTFAQLLARVRDTTLGAYAHQDIPFEKLVERLVPRRDLAHPPIFQVMLTAQNANAEAIQFAGLATTPLDVHTGIAKFDLTLKLLFEREGRIRAALEYATDLFDRATIERLVGNFQTLLEAAVANPHARISELEILTAAERQVLADWGRTGRTYPDSLLVHELWESQAARTPDNMAAFYNGRCWTFGEVNEQANQLAGLLWRLKHAD